MHIVFLVHDFPVRGLSTGGAGNYVANMAKIMANHGHNVEVITEAIDNDCFEWKGVKVYHISATRGFANNGRHISVLKKIIKNFLRSFWYNLKVFEINRKERIDLVQSVNTFGIALFRLRKIPYIVRMSSYPALWGGAARVDFNFEKSVASRRIDEEIQFIALKRADMLLSPSILVKNLVMKKIHKDVLLVESPIVVDDESQLEFKESQISPNKYIITYGALTYRKSIHTVVKVIDEFLESYSEMKYVIVGKNREIYYNGEYIMVSKMFEQNIIKHRDRFVFMGEISDRQRLFSIIKNAYACVLPTRIDNLPNTCLEAMALGKIVISSTSIAGTSVEQLIVDGEDGFLTQVDDVDDLLQKINYVMNLSPTERISIETAARKRVESLDSQNVYEVMMNIYESVMEKKREK